MKTNIFSGFYRLGIIIKVLTIVLMLVFQISVEGLLGQCIPSTCCSGQGITRVQFNTIDKSSTANNYVSDFTSTSTTVEVGSSYNLTITSKSYSAYSSCYVRVWIDWNNDGSFNTTTGSPSGSGEQYTLGTKYGGTGTTSSSPLSITIPSSASSGSVRMRVSGAYNSYTTACASYADAEFEDYTLNINTGPSLSYASSSYCSSGSDPSPTLTGNTGAGTYSSTAGLSINSSTGVIDLSASTADIYTITYTDTDTQTATFDVTISSDTYYVSTTGSDSNNGITSGSAYATLQKAIDMVGSSCASTTINVAAGTYNENGVLISNKSNINIVGAGISSTIFSGGHTNRFMGITGTSDNISISNMQIYQMDEGTVNGTYSGGGMYISCSGTVDLTSLHFEGCRCDVNGGSGGGGAIYVGSSASVNIYKSLFESNRNSRTHSSQDGGAICNTGTIHIENSLFYNNEHETSNGYDGVIVFKGGGDGTIVNSTITKSFNNTNGRIPIYVDGSGSTVTILNSILYGYPGGYDIRKNSTPTIKSINCIGYTGNVWGGTETNCYTTTDFGFSDLGSYDFSLASSSYCKDKGTSSISSPVSLTAPSDDFAGTTRSGNPDVGCYEDNAPPSILSFTPSSGCAGELVVVTGSGFTGVTSVKVGGVEVSSFTVDNDTQISATVASGSSGVMNVTNPSGSASSSGSFTFSSSPVISSQPSAATIVTGHSDTLRVVSSGSPSYQWQYSSDDSNWSDVLDGTPSNVLYSGNTVNELIISTNTSISSGSYYYRCVLTDGCVVNSNSASVSIVQYCSSTGGVLSGVSGVVLNTLSNTSTSLDRYTDYSAVYTTELYLDEAYSISVYSNTGGAYTNYQTVWIDWNQDGDFSDPGEKYQLGTVYNNSNGLSSSCPYSITVPSDAAIGFTKMRVQSKYQSYGSECQASFDGEVEDYGIYVLEKNLWTGSVSSDWLVAGNWSAGVVPTSSETIVIPNVTNQPIISSDVTLAGLTIDSGADITISSNSLTVTGAIDLNGTINIGDGTVNADGDFDATGGTIDFTDVNGNLVLSSTVTSLGSLDDLMGIVIYDGGTQTVLADSYYNLSISTAGTKTAAGNIDVNGDLTTAATATCKLDLSTYDLSVAGDLAVGAIDGLDLSDPASLVTFDGASDQNVSHAGSSSIIVGYELVNYDFESSSNGWTAGGSVGGMVFNRVSSPSPFSLQGNATTVWSTNPFDNYGNNDGAYVTSPSIDMTNMNIMTFSIDVRYETESGYDGAVIYYSTDNFSTMTRLGSNGSGTNWYSETGIDGPNDRYSEIIIDEHAWAGTAQTAWQTAIISIPGALEGQSNVKFRIYFGSDGNSNDIGFAFDNVLITGTYIVENVSQASNLTINKSGGDVVLSSEFTVNGISTFTAGIIDATSNDLTFTGNATVTGASDASHVIGVVNKNTNSTSQFIFPIGDGTTYSPIAITPNATSSTDWEVSYSNTAYSDLSIDASGLDHVSSNEYWNLNRVSGTANAVVDIWWTSSDAVTDYTDLAIAHYNGTDWEMIATSPYGTNSSGDIRSQGPVTSFSPFTIGTTSNVNALPVGLVMFEGEEVNQKNKLIWQVASEKNVDHFIIEKTKDGEFFEFVGSSVSEQLEFEVHDYSLMDDKVEPIINYYRLTAVDLNGVKNRYSLISIDNRSMKVEKEVLKITNMWGQDIQPGYKGQVIYIYTDGSIERTFKFD